MFFADWKPVTQDDSSFPAGSDARTRSCGRLLRRLRSGLGSEFRSEVHRVVKLLSDHQRVGPIVDAGTKTALRGFNLNRFPYRLVYSIEAGGILIGAVAHQHRRSGYWRNRVEEPIPMYTVELAA